MVCKKVVPKRWCKESSKKGTDSDRPLMIMDESHRENLKVLPISKPHMSKDDNRLVH